jgi:hypothetical protein
MGRDERKNFQDMQHDGEDTSDHIFHSLKAVAHWLESQGVATDAAAV